MAENTLVKIKYMLVEEINKHKEIKFISSKKREEAIQELSAYIKEICSKMALTIPDMVILIRSLAKSRISEILWNFIQSSSRRKLKREIRRIIIACDDSEYSSFSMHKGWNRTKRHIFGKWFYYYDQSFVNPYSILDSDLPLYINRDWGDVNLKTVYMNRMFALSAR